MVRTISGAIIFGSPSLYKTSLPCDHPKEPPLARGRVSRARRRLHRARRREPPARVRGARAFTYLEHQMQFGPRVPGTPAHERTGDWILEHLRATADTVAVQGFTHVTRQGTTLQLRNFFARFRPAATERVLLLAHWHTRPPPDQSANLGQQRLPVPGA